jgi:hypothetical protein
MNKSGKFISNAIKIHGDKYVYDKVEYKNNRTDVIIYCNLHGYFYQKPHNHLSGKGCISCAGNKKMDIESFIEKSNIKHDFKYDYSKSKFTNSSDCIIIICPEHGEFEQRVVKHVNGSGCHVCGGSENLSKDEFILKSVHTHGKLYDYSKVEYSNNKCKVNIICKLHGVFKVSPSNHMRGSGCPKCSKKFRYNTNEFIKEASNIHNNKYSYDNAIYKNTKTKIKIICPKHGEFLQTPNSHLSGGGCSRCKSSKGEMVIENILNGCGINYKKQFKFEDLRYKSYLKFDFAILNESDELLLLIEYNGEHHYNFRGQYGMTKKQFDLSQMRDRMKIDYCKENTIKLFIIKYNDDIELKINSLYEELCV